MKVDLASATAGIAATIQASNFQLPDPVAQAVYTSIAAVVGWAVGAALSWLAKKLGKH